LRAGAQLRAQEDFQVSVDVTNTSTRAGEELVQLYIREPISSIARPVLELKQFAWVALQPGETGHVTFTIKRAELASVRHGMRHAVTPGAYRIAIGPNSAELLETRFEVSNAKDSLARNAGAHVQQTATRGKRTKVESGVR
jgi:beta-glucosidase